MRTAGACHASRAEYRPGQGLAKHSHDFVELFWVEQGKALHWVGDAPAQPLDTGVVVFIRAGDTHAMTSKQPFTIVNVAMPADAGHALERRYNTHLWRQDGEAPLTLPLRSKADLRELSQHAEALALDVGPTRRRDLFWLHLLEILASPIRPDEAHAVPYWLEQALTGFNEQDLQEGLPALVRRSHRSREHLARSMKTHLGMSATAWINRQRMDRAAYLLRMTNRTIIDIALDVGFEQLSYFYQRFREEHGTTPRRYRLHERSLTRGG